MASSSLSSVVSNLVRASMGTSVSPMVTNEDLDRHIAELILKEAKKKAQKYSETGIRAFLRNASQPDSNAPRANKRFLSSIIRSTDDHNKTILRAQAVAAQEIKRERAEQERRERRARAEEAVQARKRSGKTRWSSSSSSSAAAAVASSSSSSRRKEHQKHDDGDDGGESWDRWDGRTADRKRKPRDWETWDGEDEDGDEERERDDRKRRRYRSRSRDHRREKDSRSRRNKRDRSRPRERRKSRERTSRRSRSRSPSADGESDERTSKKPRSRHSHKSRRRSTSHTRSLSPSTPRKRSLKYALDDDFSDDERGPANTPRRSPSPPCPSEDHVNIEDRESELRRKLISTRRQEIYPSRTRAAAPSRSPSPSAKRHKASSSSSQTFKTRSPTRSRSPTPGPAPSTQPPSKMDKYFEETYDPRLDVAPLAVPQVPATGLINNADFEGWDAMLELIRVRREDKEEKKRLERLGLTKEKVKDRKKVVVGDSGVESRWNGEGVSIMDIEYKKRGTVREWDLGKEGF